MPFVVVFVNEIIGKHIWHVAVFFEQILLIKVWVVHPHMGSTSPPVNPHIPTCEFYNVRRTHLLLSEVKNKRSRLCADSSLANEKPYVITCFDSCGTSFFLIVHIMLLIMVQGRIKSDTSAPLY